MSKPIARNDPYRFRRAVHAVTSPDDDPEPAKWWNGKDRVPASDERT